MARGWDSKSVESQIESAETEIQGEKRGLLPEAGRLRKKQSLLLSRSRVLQQLDHSQNPRHQEMLQRALADLDAELAEFE